MKEPTFYRVLVIDDNTLVAQLTALTLEEMGHNVQVASDGPSGLLAAHEFLPEVVLCDISLPGDMDGYAVARALRGAPATQSALLIAVTGYDDDQYVRRAKDAGFDDLLPKPLDVERLDDLLASPRPERI